MDSSLFREKLEREFEDRRRNNSRYSLRAFATSLETDHSTLSQIIRGKRPIPASQLRRWGKKLGMTREEVAVYVAAQHVPPMSTRTRQEQLRHWTAEGLAIVTDRSHWQIVNLSRSKGFRGDSRVVAGQLGVPVDQINVSLSRLLRLRLLKIQPGGRWKVLLNPEDLTEAAFRRLALIRVRELAAEDGVKLPQLASKVRQLKGEEQHG